MIFSKNNTPPGYYVYLYLREDKTPYYVGKGKNKRAWRKLKGEVCPPEDHARIIIFEHSLTEPVAYDLESKLVIQYGRKDIGTGILRNRTDGGKGPSSADLRNRWLNPDSAYHSQSWRDKNSTAKSKQWSDPTSTYNSLEYRKKLSESISKGKLTPEARKRNADARSIIVWIAIDPSGIEYRFKNLNQFCRENNLNKTIMSNIANGHGKTYYGWRCFKA